MEALEEMIKSIESVKNRFSTIDSLESEIQTKECQTLEKIITLLTPIISKISKLIQIRSWSMYGRNNEEEFYSENGIELIDGFEKENTGDYPHQDNYCKFSGESIFLTESLKLIKLKYSGSGSQWQGEETHWEAEISNYSVIELLKNYWFDNVLQNIINSFKRVSEEIKGKETELQIRLQKLEQIQKILQ